MSDSRHFRHSATILLIKTVLAITIGLYTIVKAFNWMENDKMSIITFMSIGTIGAIIGWFIPDLIYFFWRSFRSKRTSEQ